MVCSSDKFQNPSLEAGWASQSITAQHSPISFPSFNKVGRDSSGPSASAWSKGVMHEQTIVDNIISQLNTENCSIIKISLICTEKTLRERLEKDVADGVRKSDVIPRGLAYLPLYSKVGSVKIDTSEKTPEEVVEEIINVSDNG